MADEIQTADPTEELRQLGGELSVGGQVGEIEATERHKIILMKNKTEPHDLYEDRFARASGPRGWSVDYVATQNFALNVSTVTLLADAFVLDRAEVGYIEHIPIAHHKRTKIQKFCTIPKYGGIIFTSKRAVEIFSLVIDFLKSANYEMSDIFPPWFPLYVVGEATARAVREIGLHCPVLGEHTGNAANLAKFILPDYNGREMEDVISGIKPPLLFPVGDKHRDILPKTLQSSDLHWKDRICLKEVIVYDVRERTDFPEELKAILAGETDWERVWVVMFSPTGIKNVLKVGGWVNEQGTPFTSLNEENGSPRRRVHIASIGPTTKTHMQQIYNLLPDATAPKPNPDGIFNAIEAYYSKH